MDHKTFYQRLMQEITAVLKPYGFKKNGTRFCRSYENGLAQEVELQKSRFNIKPYQTFTININMGLLSTPITKESWKGCFLQIRRHLGETLTDGLDHQFWYHVVLPEDERIKEGRLYLFGTKAPAQPTENDLWVPYLSMEEICQDVCHLLTAKAIPYFEAVPDLDSYLELLFLSHSKGATFHTVLDEANYVLYAQVFGQRFLPLLEEGIRFTTDILEKGEGGEDFIRSFQHRLAMQQALHQMLTSVDSK